MSDVSQGSGWWQASDLKWYPPELHADYVAPLPPPPKLPPPPGQPPVPPTRPADPPPPVTATPPPPSGQSPRRRALIAAVAATVVILAAAGTTGYLLRQPSTTSQPSITPTGTTTPTDTTTMTTAAAPPVAEAALDGLLLSPDQINAAMGTTGITVVGTWKEMGDNSARISDKACLFTITTDEVAAYAGSGFSAVRSQGLSDAPGGANAAHNVGQTVVLFSSAHDADAFFTTSAQSWPVCANRQYSIDGGDVYTVGPVSNTSGTLSTTRTRSRDGQICQFGLTVANNVAIGTDACSGNQSDFQSDAAVNIAHQIAAK